MIGIGPKLQHVKYGIANGWICLVMEAPNAVHTSKNEDDYKPMCCVSARWCS